ncbi:MAG: LAGLIDADG family homing endonuclease [Methanosarcinales archaeon]
MGTNLDKPQFASRKISLYNTDRMLIDFVQKLLNKFEINSFIYIQPTSTAHFGKKRVYALRISSKKSITKFYDLVGFSIERKQNKLKKVVKSFYKIGPTTDKIIKLLQEESPLSAEDLGSKLGISALAVKSCIYGSKRKSNKINLLKKRYIKNINSNKSRVFAKYILTKAGKEFIK